MVCATRTVGAWASHVGGGSEGQYGTRLMPATWSLSITALILKGRAAPHPFFISCSTHTHTAIAVFYLESISTAKRSPREMSNG